MKIGKKTAAVGISYITWQIIFPIVISPLVLGILTAEQMGYTLATLPMGILVGAVLTVTTTGLAATPLGLNFYTRGLGHVKTREDFERFWSATLRGSDDGLIAETHWSGTILPLLMMAFAGLGIPYPFTAIPAIFLRWLGHVGVHLLFPKDAAGERLFGGVGFFAKGLIYSDVINSLSFLISGNIVAPAMLHHLGGYASTWAGNKKRVAKRMGIPLE